MMNGVSGDLDVLGGYNLGLGELAWKWDASRYMKQERISRACCSIKMQKCSQQ